MRRFRRHGFTLVEVMMSSIIVALIVITVGALYLAATRVWIRTSAQSQSFSPAFLAQTRIATDLRNAAYVQIPDYAFAAGSEDWEENVTYQIGDAVKVKLAVYNCIKSHTSVPTKYPTISPTYWEVAPSFVVMFRPLVEDDEQTFISPQDNYQRTVTMNTVPLQVSYTDVIMYYLSDDSGDVDRKGNHLWRKVFDMETDGRALNEENELVTRDVSGLYFSQHQYSTQRIVDVYSLAIAVIGREKATTYISNFDTNLVFKNPLPVEVPPTPIF